MRAESVFDQLFLFSIEHDVDLELTLSLPLEPVLRQLSISDCIFLMESHIEPTIERPFNIAHILDDNAILQSLTTIPAIFVEQSEAVFNQSPKAEHVGFVTDTYMYIPFISSSLISLTNVHTEEQHPHICFLVQRVGHHDTGKVL